MLDDYDLEYLYESTHTEISDETLSEIYRRLKLGKGGKK